MNEQIKITNDPVKIRLAHFNDAAEIANVHTYTWMESYKGIVSSDFLKQRPMSFRNRMKWWSENIQSGKKIKVVVAESMEHGIVGFASVEPGYDEVFQGYGEITTLYLFDHFKGQGIGQALFKKAIEELKKMEFKKAYCWVLVENPSIKFYKRMGGRLSNHKKNIELGNKLEEIAFVWDSI